MDIELPNIGSACIGVTLGNNSGTYPATTAGAYFSNVKVGGDNTPNSVGFKIYSSGGWTMEACQTLLCGNGLHLAPPIGQTVQWGFITDCLFDTGVIGIHIAPQGAGPESPDATSSIPGPAITRASAGLSSRAASGTSTASCSSGTGRC